MAVVIKKRGKYLAGHSYATGYGHSFHWLKAIISARHFKDEADAESFRQLSEGKIERVPDHYPQEWGPSDARRLTCSCGDPDPNHMEKKP